MGGSLEANLLERIATSIKRLPQIAIGERTAIHSWWQDLSMDFGHLNDNATDYIASLERGKLDELINTAAFLTYKDGIIEYLRGFIKEFQRHGPTIHALIQNISETTVNQVLEAVIAYEKDIPRIDQEIDFEELNTEIFGQWLNLKFWFGGSPERESEASRLLSITNSIIRRLTRLTYRLAETKNSLVSRHREFLHLSYLFSKCSDLKEFHLLSASILGPTN